jgi:predicted tellurium resistance membrane protein TerC
VERAGHRPALGALRVIALVDFNDASFAVGSSPVSFAIASGPFVGLANNVFSILCPRAMACLLPAADRTDRAPPGAGPARHGRGHRL